MFEIGKKNGILNSFFFKFFFWTLEKKGEKTTPIKEEEENSFGAERKRKTGRGGGNVRTHAFVFLSRSSWCALFIIPTASIFLHRHLSSLSRRLLAFSGAATKAQSTRTSWSSINFPSMFSIARVASSFSLYSIRQYPFTNPVRRSKFKCTFEISPKSPKFS